MRAAGRRTQLSHAADIWSGGRDRRGLEPRRSLAGVEAVGPGARVRPRGRRGGAAARRRARDRAGRGAAPALRSRRAGGRDRGGVRSGGRRGGRGGAVAGPFRWRAVLELGLGAMRLAPGTFWAMSLVEWRAAVEGRAPRRAAPLGRDALARMMEEFPDG